MKSIEIKDGIIYPKTENRGTYCKAINKYVLDNFKSLEVLKFVLDNYLVEIDAVNLAMTHYNCEYGRSTYVEFAEKQEDGCTSVFKIFEEFIYCFGSDIDDYIEWYSFIKFTELESPIEFKKHW